MDFVLSQVQLFQKVETQRKIGINRRECVDIMVVWTKPEHPWLKLNVDGARSGNTGRTSATGIITNDEGAWMAGFSGETGGVLEYLQGIQIEDPNFFYAIQVDEDDLITNIFWEDAKMKVDYDDFGDVVCFDTTYQKQKNGRPIALFVGVNHHKQTAIFGAALLFDETSYSFVWLFDTFARQ
ncbi:hypothetical protein V2J09_022432 [Rumex salicifolius]